MEKWEADVTTGGVVEGIGGESWLEEALFSINHKLKKSCARNS
jgi:hypothetical protein